MYEYLAKVDESKYPQGAYDGDTIDLIIDVGFKMTTRQRIRLVGVNTPELRGDSKLEGLRFRELTRQWLKRSQVQVGYDLIIKTQTWDSFGRYLAIIERRFPPTPLSRIDFPLNDYLLSIGCPEYES
jgi:micrococcal nuclease|tara:strand:- start:83 stop:463 length:381 start_codon:yes stop_codon:yes gene_type:complete